MPAMSNQTKESLAILALAFLTALSYLFSLNAPFYLDDQHMIVDNIFIKNPQYFSWLWKGYVTNASIPRGMCRPFLMMTFIFNYLSASLDASGYRIINILIHFLNGTLLYSLFKIIRPQASKTFLWLITALFLLHPINTETVIYISSRSDLLTAFFILSAMILWIKDKYIPAMLIYVMALLTKETAMCLPMIILAWDYFKLGSVRKLITKKYFFLYSVLALLTIVYITYRSTVFSSTPVTPVRSIWDNTLIQTAMTFVYARLFFLLKPFNMMHDIAGFNNILNFSVIAGMILIISMIIYTGKQRIKAPLISFALAWFLLALTPKFYARLGFPSMEHHAYIPLFGIYILLILILEKYYIAHKKLFLYLFATFISACAIITIIRGAEYNNPITFWSLSAQRAPAIGALHNNLGIEYLKKNLIPQAENEFNLAIAIGDRKETIVTAKTNLASIFSSQKKYAEALKLLNETSTITKIIPVGINEMRGVIYMDMGKKEEAIKAWEQEISLYPDAYEAILNLAIYYFKSGDNKRAEILFKRAVFLKPDSYLGYYGLGQIMEKIENLPRAAEMYSYAVRLNPHDAAAHYFLGSVLSRLGDSRAIQHLQTAIELNPRFCEARNDLAVVYASLKEPRWDMAKKELTAAELNQCTIDKDFIKLVSEHNP